MLLQDVEEEIEPDYRFTLANERTFLAFHYPLTASPDCSPVA